MAIELKKPDLKNIKIGRKKSEPSGMDISGGVVFGSPSPSAASAGFSASSGFGSDDSAESFGVSVRNEAAGIKVLDKKAEAPWWKRELSHEIATGAALMSFFAFALAAAGAATIIPFCLAGVIVYTLLVFLEEMTEVRVKLLAAAGVAATALILLVIFRKFIGGGLGNVMNAVYEASEFVQAYIYKKYPISEAAQNSPETSMKVAAVWASCLAGALGAMPPSSVRRLIGLGVAAFTLIAFAYYGLIPTVLVVILAIIAIMFVMSRGGILAAIPVLLAAFIFFGVIMAINPGENYAISRVDENLRDRLALRSAYLQTNLDQDPFTQDEDLFEEQQEEEENEFNEFTTSHKWLIPLLITLFILAAIAGFAYWMYKRYIRRRDANREGIDSEDLRTAIISMFRYAVRWLGASGIDVSGKSFASLVDPLRRDVSEQYSNYFTSMYVLWREAAYSDHEIEEAKREDMKTFMNDTREMVEKNLDWRGKIMTALKYAL